MEGDVHIHTVLLINVYLHGLLMPKYGLMPVSQTIHKNQVVMFFFESGYILPNSTEIS